MNQQSFLENMREITEHRVIQDQRSITKEFLLGELSAKNQPLDFVAHFQTKLKANIIAEIKRASPTKGEFASELSATDCALAFSRSGASAISVLTEPNYFGGSLANLQEVRNLLPKMPLLMKDFILDHYQLLQARYYGADAVLLIHSFLERSLLSSLFNEAIQLGLTPLLEVHNENELEVALQLGAKLIGVNSRNLHTLQIDPTVQTRLAAKFPNSDAIFLAESGIQNADQIRTLSHLGYHGFLIGSKLMEAKDPERSLRKIQEAKL